MAGATLANAGAVAETIEQRDEREAERREDLAETYSLQQRLERQLAEESIDVPIGDETVEFRPFGREASQFASLCQEHLENIDEENIEAEFDEALDRMYAVAADFSKPDELDLDWWERNFSIPRIIAVLTFVNTEGRPLSEDESKK
ncbi:hypothetical protein GS429_08400 [Natronorubrum sp. JWXQ-INN-674]|uniref:Uncharacterized protein n=1 Tax=Natronorubrum halalkaliphilum TaxID=2691917 RepID=A0A6B0VKH9_9EURY|nr:hypothetical protein [Natronorubrum halalkaliphilum]MXV62080.1 hypothetical protein [Natronorubrum halalkaliphilum]